MAGYKVLIDDNYHFTNEEYRVEHGAFDTATEAIAACKQVVDECLEPMLEPGMTATALYRRYERFGDDPLVVPVDPNDPPVAFSGWQYARQRCEVLGAKSSPLVLPPGAEDVTSLHSGTVFSIIGVKPSKG